MATKLGPGRRKRPETAHLQARVVELRGQRYKWDDIAKITGKSPAHCCELYGRALAEIPIANVVQAREEECRLVDDAISSLLKDIAKDEAKDTSSSFRSRIEAWGQIRGWSEHRARMLGLNAPVKSQIQVITEDHIDNAIKELEAKLAANDAVNKFEHARTET